jgi:hypothetical protein
MSVDKYGFYRAAPNDDIKLLRLRPPMEKDPPILKG